MVTPLPAAAGLSRVAYKYYFALTNPQWAIFTSKLYTANTIKTGHVACFSSINYETYASPPVQTQAPMSASTNPLWLGTPAIGNTCYSDVFQPFYP